MIAKIPVNFLERVSSIGSASNQALTHEAVEVMIFCQEDRRELLTDAQLELVGSLLPGPPRRRDNRGRPWASNRACLEGILWVLQSGAAWRFLPDEYPSLSTCRRRLKQWEEEDVWLDAWRTFLGALDAEGLLNWDEAFLDGSFAPAKKGAMQPVKPCAASS